jgi:hypothetical protein
VVKRRLEAKRIVGVETNLVGNMMKNFAKVVCFVKNYPGWPKLI